MTLKSLLCLGLLFSSLPVWANNTTLQSLISEFNYYENTELSVKPFSQVIEYSEVHWPLLEEKRTSNAQKKSVSLRLQFLREPDQGSAGSCLTFSGISMMEAAYYRVFGEKIKFSEQWMLRLKIGSTFKNASVAGNYAGLYMGLPLDDLLWWSKRAGLCQASNYRYNGWLVDQYESLKLNNGSKDFPKKMERFAKDFYLLNNGKLAPCKADLVNPKYRFFGFESIDLPLLTLEQLKEVLNRALPVQISLHGIVSPKLVLRNPHSVLVTGYSDYYQEFYIRNSWGVQGVFSSGRSFQYRYADSYFNTDVFSLPAVLVHSSERPRICVETEKLPTAIQEWCEQKN